MAFKVTLDKSSYLSGPSSLPFPLHVKLLVYANHRGLGLLEPGQPAVERSGKGWEVRSLGLHCIIALLKSSKE